MVHKILVCLIITAVLDWVNYGSTFFIGSCEDAVKSLMCLAQREHPITVDAVE